MRASFAGTLQLSAVSVAVKAYAVSVEDEEPLLRQLHQTCVAPLVQQFACSACGKVVPSEEQVKGAKVPGKGWVVFSKEELRSESEERLLAVDRLVRLGEVNPLWYARAYYLAPAGATGLLAYTLLSGVLRQAHLGAVVTFVSYRRDRLGVVMPAPSGLVLRCLHWAAAVRELAQYGLEVQSTRPHSDHVRLLRQLCNGMVKPFQYAAFVDETRARLVRLLDQKPAARCSTVPSQPSAMVVSLTDRLRASIQDVKRARGVARRAGRGRRRVS